MQRMLMVVGWLVLVAGAAPVAAQPSGESDASAIGAAEAVLERMGGRDAWNATRYLQWRFFGRRHHSWDRFTDDVRIESEDLLVLMNVHSKQGRAFRDGQEITDPAELAEALEQGYAWWVNDSYWFIMPYKLLDPGVHLRDGGSSPLEDGRPARKLVVTFDAGVGLTPRNRYEVWIAEDTGLVEQWAYYADAEDPEPKFVLPWADWQAFGEPPILLATRRGRNADWEIAVPSALPPELFVRP